MNEFRFPVLIVGLLLALHVSLGRQSKTPQQTPTPPIAATTAPPLNPTEVMRKTVAFLEVAYQDGPNHEAGVIGTGFFVSVPEKRLGDKSFIYLVTNRHVAEPGIEMGKPHVATEMFVRLNLSSPRGDIQSMIQRVPLGQQFKWYFPQDGAVDLAVMPLAPRSDLVSYVPIESSIMVTADQVKNGDVNLGDHLVFAGYFSNFPGRKRIEPIVREGVIAMLPDEEMATTLDKPGQLYLADLHAFHGNSGSPVFVNVNATPHHGIVNLAGEKYLLLGVISGYYPESVGFSVPAAQVLTGEVRDNSGIATIVPADEIIKLLNSTELQAQRDREVAALKGKP